jgi:DNA-binding IclR family transcriptional regulator
MNQTSSLSACDLDVLSALLRLARKSEVADEAALLLRVDASPADLRNALRGLEKAGLLERTPNGARVRLLMPGFALAVAFAGSRRSARRKATVRRAA